MRQKKTAISSSPTSVSPSAPLPASPAKTNKRKAEKHGTKKSGKRTKVNKKPEREQIRSCIEVVCNSADCANDDPDSREKALNCSDITMALKKRKGKGTGALYYDTRKLQPSSRTNKSLPEAPKFTICRCKKVVSIVPLGKYDHYKWIRCDKCRQFKCPDIESDQACKHVCHPNDLQANANESKEPDQGPTGDAEEEEEKEADDSKYAASPTVAHNSDSDGGDDDDDRVQSQSTQDPATDRDGCCRILCTRCQEIRVVKCGKTGSVYTNMASVERRAFEDMLYDIQQFVKKSESCIPAPIQIADKLALCPSCNTSSPIVRDPQFRIRMCRGCGVMHCDKCDHVCQPDQKTQWQVASREYVVTCIDSDHETKRGPTVPHALTLEEVITIYGREEADAAIEEFENKKAAEVKGDAKSPSPLPVADQCYLRCPIDGCASLAVGFEYEYTAQTNITWEQSECPVCNRPVHGLQKQTHSCDDSRDTVLRSLLLPNKVKNDWPLSRLKSSMSGNTSIVDGLVVQSDVPYDALPDIIKRSVYGIACPLGDEAEQNREEDDHVSIE